VRTKLETKQQRSRAPCGSCGALFVFTQAALRTFAFYAFSDFDSLFRPHASTIAKALKQPSVPRKNYTDTVIRKAALGLKCLNFGEKIINHTP